MQYKIINDRLTKTTETGSYQEIDATYLDAKEVAIPIKVQVPIITFEEVSPDPVNQVIENMNYDLEKKKGEVNERIKEYNEMIEKINAIKKDIPEIGLADVVAMKIIK